MLKQSIQETLTSVWKQFAVPPTITLERRRAAGAATCSDPERIAHFRSWQAVLPAVFDGVACGCNSRHEKIKNSL